MLTTVFFLCVCSCSFSNCRPCEPNWAFTTDILTEADVVGGFWAIRQEWVRLLFRETPITWYTGEDYHLTYSVSKYAGLRTFLAPKDPKDPQTLYQSKDYMAISHAGDTTEYTLYPYEGRSLSGPDLRDGIVAQLWLRGNPRHCPYMTLEDYANVLVVAETPTDADNLAEATSRLRERLVVAGPSHPRGARLWVVAGRTDVRADIARRLGFDEALFGTYTLPDVGAFDLGVGTQWPRRERARDALADALRAMGQMIEAVAPPVIIIPARASAVLAGVSLAAHYAQARPSPSEFLPISPRLRTVLERSHKVKSEKTTYSRTSCPGKGAGRR